MRVIILHNAYQKFGGEDFVVDKQYKQLQFKNVNAKKILLKNEVINTYSNCERVDLFLNNLFLKEVRKELLGKIDEFEPDIVHIHNVYPLITPRIYKVLKSRNIFVIQTLHNYRFLCPNGQFFQNGRVCEECTNKNSYYQCAKYTCYRSSKIQSFWYARMISLAKKRGYFDCIDKFIALNEFMSNKMISQGYSPEKFTILPNSLDDNASKSPTTKENYYLYIGRLSEEKGIKTLCESAKQSSNQFKIVGTGPLEEYIKKVSIETPNIEYLGFVKGKQKEDIIAQAKATIVPSEWYENLPTVIIESFMHSTPVIVSKLGGAQYMVDEGINGEKFEAGNINSLLEAIKRFESNNQQSYQSMARKKFLETYHEDVVVDKLIKVYEDLLSEK